MQNNQLLNKLIPLLFFLLIFQQTDFIINMSVSKEEESSTSSTTKVASCPLGPVNLQNKLQQFQVESLIDQFLASINPDYQHISNYFDQIIQKLLNLKREKLLKIPEGCQQKLGKSQKIVYSKLKNVSRTTKYDESLIEELQSCKKHPLANSDSYSLARSQLHKIVDIVKDAEDGLLPPKETDIPLNNQSLQLHDQFIKVIIQNSIPKNIEAKGQKYDKMPDNLNYSDVEAIEITYLNIKTAKIIGQNFPNLKRLKVQTLNDTRGGGSSYSSYGYLQSASEGKDVKILKEISKFKKLEEIDFVTHPSVDVDQYALFLSSLPLAKTLILKNNTKTGACLVEILARKNNYENIKLFGSSNQLALSKQSVDFMYKTVPGLKSLVIENPSFDSQQLQIISKFDKLQQLKLYSRDYKVSPLDLYSYGYDEEQYGGGGGGGNGLAFGGFGTQRKKDDKKDKLLVTLLKNFPNMKSFTFNYRFVRPGDIELILHVLPQLEELSFQTVGEMPPKQFQFLAQFRHLTSLLIKCPKITSEAIEPLSRAKFRLKYLFVNFSMTTLREERERAQRRQEARRRRQRDQRREIADRAPRNLLLAQQRNDDEDQERPSEPSLSALLRNQTELEQIKIENRASDKICEDLSYIPNLKQIQINTVSMSSDGYNRSHILSITNSGLAYLSKLRKVEKLKSQQGGTNTIPNFSNQFFRFVKNNRSVMTETHDIQLLEEKDIRNIGLLGRGPKIDLEGRRQLVQSYRPGRYRDVEY